MPKPQSFGLEVRRPVSPARGAAGLPNGEEPPQAVDDLPALSDHRLRKQRRVAVVGDDDLNCVGSQFHSTQEFIDSLIIGRVLQPCRSWYLSDLKVLPCQLLEFGILHQGGYPRDRRGIALAGDHHENRPFGATGGLNGGVEGGVD